MSLIEAIVLGLTQGLTEFLPISSSGHLILVPWLFGWEEPGLAFDAALHLGTLVAVFAYFWRELLAMLAALPRALQAPRALLRGPVNGETEADTNARLALLLVIGSIPGGVLGLALQGTLDDFFHGDTHRNAAIALFAIFSIVFALLLWAAERLANHRRQITDVGLLDAIVVGCAQALALVPGTSRSGVTITAGLFRELKRADAARFAFLLGVPLITLAGLKGLADLVQNGAGDITTLEIAVGIATSCLSGFASIWVLLRFLQRSSTMVFVIYRIVVGVVVLLILATSWR